MLASPPVIYSAIYNPANFLNDVETQIANLNTTKQDVINSAARLNAIFVGNGSVSNTKFNFLNDVTGPIQSQINSLDTVVGVIQTNYENIDNTSVTTTLLNTNRFKGLVKTISNATTYSWPTLPYYINVISSISLILPNPGNTTEREGYTVDIINSARNTVTITVSAGTGSQEIERDGISTTSFVLNRRARKMVVLGAVWCVLGYNDT